MGFLGSLQNGSPFNIGYEYTAPELTAPTALASLAKLYDADATAKTITKKDATTDGTETAKSLVIPGTEGTRNTIIGTLETIDADIASVKAKIKKNFDRDVNPTVDQAIAASSDLAKQLGTLIAQKNQAKMQISASNQDLTNLETYTAAYKGKESTMNEKAMQLVGDIYVPIGTDENGDILSYGDAVSLAQKADNTTLDANGRLMVNLPDYSGLTMGTEQSGALDKKVDDVYSKAKESNKAYGELNVESEGDLAGFIKGYTGSNNDAALLTVADVIRKKLKAPELADLGAQTSTLVANKDINKDEITKVGLTDVEIAAVEKSNSTPSDLTKDELISVKSAQDKVLAAKVKGEIGLYKESTFTPSLSKVSGSGDSDKKKSVVVTIGQPKKLQIAEPTIVNALSIDQKDVVNGLYNTTVDEINFSDNPLNITVSAPKYVFNPKTGVSIDVTKGNTDINIQGVDRGVNPKTGKTEYWAWGQVIDPADGKTPIDMYTPLTPIMKEKIEIEYGIDLGTIKSSVTTEADDLGLN